MNVNIRIGAFIDIMKDTHASSFPHLHIISIQYFLLNIALLQKRNKNKVFLLHIPGPPATVEVDIMVRSMGPISEVDMVRQRM